jgi:hypothetical protein
VLSGPLLQGQSNLSGTVREAGSGTPLAYVNIGLEGRSVGTVSDQAGTFRLFVPDSVTEAGAMLRISSLGYATVRLPFEGLQEGAPTEIFLQPEAIALEEVVLSALPDFSGEEMVGNPLQHARDYAYWKDSLALGAELASRIRASRDLRKLNTFFFSILENPADSLLLRLNIYDPPKNGSGMGENRNRSGKGILFVLRRGTREAAVDLEPFDIWVTGDFIASLELLDVYGSDRIALTLPATQQVGGATYRRYASQGKWEQIGAYEVGYHLQATFYTDNARRAENRKVARQLQKTQGPIQGFVFLGRRGQADIRVKNLNTNAEARTDARGWYQIEASPGDLLRITRPNGEHRVVKVEKIGNLTVNLSNL